ncbi:MAG: T9SS type A sorting domain-containing protein, partial [Bacteroidota bacterium]
PPAPISPNQSPFIIGSAPWDTYSFQFYGTLDEVRVWNTARTEEQLQDYMHKELKGDEPGLVAYYNFNTAHDSVVPDKSPNGNNGLMKNGNDPCWSYADSYAPVGDEKMYDMHDVTAAWYGKSPDLFNYAVTNKGLTVIAAIEAKEFNKYVLFGHNAGTGTATDYAPTNAPADFQRLSREWYLNKGGSVSGDMYFNLTEASGGGAVLPSGAKDSLYVLLYRSNITQNFRILAYAGQVIGDILVFRDQPFSTGYYCIGYASTVIPPTPPGIDEQVLGRIRLNPNPASDEVTLYHGQGLKMVITDVTGQVIKELQITAESQPIDISALAHGLYFLRICSDHRYKVEKLIVE